MECVRQRCNCSNVTNVDVSAPGYTPSGMYCAAGGFEENGFTYCDQMNECFEDFWRCATDNLMHKHYTAATLNSAEQGAVDNILLHGRTSGEKFEDTDIYRDCRMIQCEAAASRKNCGLITCAPNYTQCYEFIKPPPLPYNHQLCTEGCRAVLMLMAVTVTTFAFAVLCCACCPAPVRVVAPLITKEDSEEDEKKSNKSKSKSGSHSSSKSGHTTRSPSHASE
ncbi:hypothetical protein AGDE_12473 [Angomonas deanei]|uniref:Uncharacterized protein n=1 Tax=Angomonas deanei TaxID=59799 RepID=A0A7G2CB07_9TRYP|nr:hypothetical protein AGDE_12473 [Angomonas deanei]CAD2217050.1 hypothetical protein, conserved [Angomonas deanei]|eukprot:EPY24138.1 hypothetical protein AGDE_12473 [Angomonas deanei]